MTGRSVRQFPVFIIGCSPTGAGTTAPSAISRCLGIRNFSQYIGLILSSPSVPYKDFTTAVLAPSFTPALFPAHRRTLSRENLSQILVAAPTIGAARPTATETASVPPSLSLIHISEP